MYYVTRLGHLANLSNENMKICKLYFHMLPPFRDRVKNQHAQKLVMLIYFLEKSLSHKKQMYIFVYRRSNEKPIKFPVMHFGRHLCCRIACIVSAAVEVHFIDCFFFFPSIFSSIVFQFHLCRSIQI